MAKNYSSRLFCTALYLSSSLFFFLDFISSLSSVPKAPRIVFLLLSSNLLSLWPLLVPSLHYFALFSTFDLKFLPVSGLCFVPLLFVFSLSSSFVFLVLLCLSRSPSSHLSSFVSLALLRLSHPPSSISSSYVLLKIPLLDLFSSISPPIWSTTLLNFRYSPFLSSIFFAALSLCSLLSLSLSPLLSPCVR